MNAIYAISSLPIGALSDRIGKRVLLGIGYSVFGLSCFGFMFVTGNVLMIAGAIFRYDGARFSYKTR
jgi:MFS family permease